MNTEIAHRWVAALRSGQYAQGIGRLRTDHDEFCCLGVLCDLHSKETGIPWKGTGNAQYYQGEHLQLPHEVMEWAEMQSPDSSFPKDVHLTYGIVNLLIANDSQVEFERIADMILANKDAL